MTGGGITGADEYDFGAIATLTATPDPGYLFTGWTGDASGTDNPLSVLMDSNKSIGATFDPDFGDYDRWQRGWFGAALDDSAQEDDLWGDNADPDHDGTVNVLEFIMGRDPLVADNHLGPQIRVESGEIIFTYPQTLATNHDVISYVSWSSDLVHWMTGGIVYNVGSVNEDTMMIEANLVPHHGDRLFMRLEALRTGAGEDPVPEGFELIPAGSFLMGDQSDPLVGYSDELPVHSVYVSGFYMGRYEVTKELWDEVRAWGAGRGYTDLAVGNGGYASKGANHPVHSITWYDMVKWCNARSQKEGLVPCYTVGGSVYRTGSSAPDCNWSANGYRLPTEAEWEKAARGGLGGRNFPWGDTINHSNANYSANGSAYSYDTSPYTSYTYHPDWDEGGYPYTSPVGSFGANGYGLYDMAGNVIEWCWDWYGGYSSGSQTDPRGPASGTYRVVRGGSWLSYARNCRAAFRSYGYPVNTLNYGGFRLVRGQ